MALSHFFATGALAQQTDGRVLIGLETAPLSLACTRLKMDAVRHEPRYEVADEGSVAYDYAFAERSDVVTKRTV